MASTTPTARTIASKCAQRGSASKRPSRPPQSAPPTRWCGCSDPDPDQRARGSGAGSTRARAAVPSGRRHQFGREQPCRTPPRAARGTGRSAQTRLSRTPQLLHAKTAGKAEPATTRPDASAERPTATDGKRAELASLAPHAAASAPGPVPEPAGSRAEQKPAIKSVSFDLHAGIKTELMTDGSVHEEPIEQQHGVKAQPAAGRGVGP